MKYENVAVVGMHFRGSEVKSLVAGLSAPASFRLEREPSNAFDANAIKVFLNDLHIGYIERDKAAFISFDMDDPSVSEPICTMTHLEDRGNNRHPICTVEFPE